MNKAKTTTNPRLLNYKTRLACLIIMIYRIWWDRLMIFHLKFQKKQI